MSNWGHTYSQQKLRFRQLYIRPQFNIMILSNLEYHNIPFL